MRTAGSPHSGLGSRMNSAISFRVASSIASSIASRTASLVATAVVVGLVAGCATAPPAKVARTTVILLPDEDGVVGAVSLRNEGGTVEVAEAYRATTVDGRARPAAGTALGDDAVGRDFAGLLRAQPPKPKSFVLLFVLDRAVLTKESEAQIPAVLEAVRERKPTEITIFGHSDATGSEAHNVKLSADRANAIATLLRKKDPTLDRIEVQFFGSRVPVVQSDARAQPRNRRAEIMIL